MDTSKAKEAVTNAANVAVKVGEDMWAEASDIGQQGLKNLQNMAGDLAKLGSKVGNLKVDRYGNVTGSLNIPKLGSVSVSFAKKGSNLVATGNVNLGGFSFTNAKFTFDSSGGFKSVEASQNFRMSFKIGKKRINLGSVKFSLGFDKNFNLQATASAKVKLGWLGTYRPKFTVSSRGGLSIKW